MSNEFNTQGIINDETYVEPETFITDKTVELEPLYDLLKSGRYKQTIGEDFFPEIITLGDRVFMGSTRWYRKENLEHRYEWLFTFDSNNRLVDDYKSTNGYLELYPKYTLVRLISETMSPESVEIEAAFKMSSNEYYKQYPDSRTVIKVVETEIDNAPKVDTPEFLYVPKPYQLLKNIDPKAVGLFDNLTPELIAIRKLLKDVHEGVIKLQRP